MVFCVPRINLLSPDISRFIKSTYTGATTEQTLNLSINLRNTPFWEERVKEVFFDCTNVTELIVNGNRLI